MRTTMIQRLLENVVQDGQLSPNTLVTLNLLIPDIYARVFDLIDAGMTRYSCHGTRVIIMENNLVDVEQWNCTCEDFVRQLDDISVIHKECETIGYCRRIGIPLQYAQSVHCEHLIAALLALLHPIFGEKLRDEAIETEVWVEMHSRL